MQIYDSYDNYDPSFLSDFSENGRPLGPEMLTDNYRQKGVSLVKLIDNYNRELRIKLIKKCQ